MDARHSNMIHCNMLWDAQVIMSPHSAWCVNGHPGAKPPGWHLVPKAEESLYPLTSHFLLQVTLLSTTITISASATACHWAER